MNEKLSYSECVAVIDALLFAYRHGFRCVGTDYALIKLMCMREDALKSDETYKIVDEV